MISDKHGNEILLYEKDKITHEKDILTSYKKILDFSCYIKIEKNGLEIKIKNLQNSPSKVFLVECSYRSKNLFNTRIMNQVQVKNCQDHEYFTFDIKTIEKTIDKLIHEGKLTLLLSNGTNDKLVVFFSKTTREVLDNFLKHLHKILHQKNTTEDKFSSITNANELTHDNNTGNIFKNKKRKIQDMYAQLSTASSNNSISQNINNIQIKKLKKDLPEKLIAIKIKKNLLDLPDEILLNLFEYVDGTNIIKITLLNKECKKIYDNNLTSLKLRDDTPTSKFNNLLKRFCLIKRLNMGKSKFIKNENFKFFDVDLRNLNYFDMSEITNLNDFSIRKFFSKMKSKNVYTLKLNFYLESLSTALAYIDEFFTNIKILEVDSPYKKNKFDRILDYLEKFPSYFHPSLYNRISVILLNKLHLNTFSIFIFNFTKISEHTNNIQIQNNLFSKLIVLSIDILIVEKVKDLMLLNSAINLIDLQIHEILFTNTKSNITNKSLIRCEFENFYIPTNNITSSIQSNFDINHDQVEQLDQLNNLTLDFENDYVEVFINIFRKLKNLLSLSLGEFVNGEILKLISLFCKNLTSLTLNSTKINDEQFKEILINCNSLKEIDIRGCEYILGSCFVELDKLPPDLKNLKMSITNFNYYNLIQFLKYKGITAENYLTI